MSSNSIIDHIERHKDKELIFFKHSKYCSDDKSCVIIRPLGPQEFWLETETGEGTAVSGGILYEALNKLFEEIM